jgi:hypothetical protein
LVGVVIAFIALALLAALTLPWRGTADSVFHLDYIKQLADGTIPAPTGVTFAFDGDPTAYDGRQYASAHPPLFYQLAAPFAADLITVDSWPAAVLIVRLINVSLGTGCVLALAWTGWELGGPRRRSIAVCVAALGALNVPLIRFAGEVYADVLLVLLSFSSLALTIRIVRLGASWRRVLVLACLMSLGMLTKATFVVVLALAITGTVAATLLHRAVGREALVAAVLRALALAVPTVVSAGWFYVRNASLSGSWYRSTPKAPVGSRPERTTIDNLADPDFWTVLPRGQFGHIDVSWGLLSNQIAAVVIAIALGGTALAHAIRQVRRRGLVTPWTLALSAVLMVGMVAGSYAVQLSHATGFGQINIRYLLPATSAAALVAASAVVAMRWWSVIVVPALMALQAFATLHYSAYLVDRSAVPTGEVLSTLRGAVAANGLSSTTVDLALAACAVSLLLVAGALVLVGAGGRTDAVWTDSWASPVTAFGRGRLHGPRLRARRPRYGSGTSSVRWRP